MTTCNEYTPEGWVLLQVEEPSGQRHYRVFGTWSGGYLDGDSWRLNSGITKVEEDDEYIRFYGESGSVYKCGKDDGICGAYNIGPLQNFVNSPNVEIIFYEDFKKVFANVVQS